MGMIPGVPAVRVPGLRIPVGLLRQGRVKLNTEVAQHEDSTDWTRTSYQLGVEDKEIYVNPNWLHI